ncbi:MAG: Rossmann-like and DUF2520 domain-containing protein [Ginsengibacter sp.]
MRVVMLGSGNTGTVLSKVIAQAGHEIVQVVSRTEENARSLAHIYSASVAPLIAETFVEADIYIMALHDVALDHIEKIPALKNKFVVHTAGAVSINALKDITSTYGVLYPLQSLSKYTENIPEMPILIDGNNQEIMHRVLGFAKTISSNVVEANDTERLNYHVAAVFVNNFTNHLYALAELFCEKERINFKNLFPLIDETTLRAKSLSPFLTQTGPAIRDDIYTLNRHLQTLAATPDLKYIYLKLSESIIKHHGKR